MSSRAGASYVQVICSSTSRRRQGPSFGTNADAPASGVAALGVRGEDDEAQVSREHDVLESGDERCRVEKWQVVEHNRFDLERSQRDERLDGFAERDQLEFAPERAARRRERVGVDGDDAHPSCDLRRASSAPGSRTHAENRRRRAGENGGAPLASGDARSSASWSSCESSSGRRGRDVRRRWP